MSDWTGTIERNRAALLRVVAVLFLMAGLDEGGAETVPRRVWRRIIRLLRPAESAARRLIVIAASGLEVAPPKPRPEKAPTSTERLQAKGLLVVHEGMNLGLARIWRPEPAAPEKPAPRLPAFPLTDPSRRFDAKAWNGLRPFPTDGFAHADENEEVDARPLCHRIQALKRALDDIDGHARRLARREARAHLASRQMQSAFASASKAKLKDANQTFERAYRIQRQTLRLGRPPGHRKRPDHEVDDILRECHSLALHAGKSDTS